MVTHSRWVNVHADERSRGRRRQHSPKSPQLDRFLLALVLAVGRNEEWPRVSGGCDRVGGGVSLTDLCMPPSDED
jgi:hypothetical protein